MDFEHIFNEMEISAAPFALCELNGRCDLNLNRQSFATLHYVLSGAGEIAFPNAPKIKIDRGTFVLIPAFQPHTLKSYGDTVSPTPDCQPAELDLINFIRGDALQNSSTKLLAVCSRVKVGLRQITDIVDLIRVPIVNNNISDAGLEGTIGKLLHELSSPRMGSKAMIRAILLQCMIGLLRVEIENNNPALKWMTALKDQRLWSVLQLMLETPGNQYSLETLANQAGMSRSVFAKRFAEAYGSGPMELLRDMRMRLAASMLEQTEMPVKRIAELVGFKSRSAFTRSFEVYHGTSPRGFRKTLG